MNSHDQQRLREGSEWWLRLRETTGADSGAEWLAWSQSDARNLDAFDRVDSLASTLRGLDRAEREELLREFAPKRSRAVRWALPFAAAAALAVAALTMAAVFYFPRLTGETTYATERAFHQELTLTDGSRVSVGASSVISVRMRTHERYIRLREGEAYFQVMKDPSRPFVVDVGEVSVTAVGTAFDVRRTGRNVTISVTEGRVRAARPSGSTVEIDAGERVSYDPESQRFDMSAVTAERATAWREKRLEFVNEPLERVIANVNRYANPRVEIVDTEAARLTFTGTVLTDNLPAWLQALPRVLPVSVHEQDGKVRVQSASKP